MNDNERVNIEETNLHTVIVNDFPEGKCFTSRKPLGQSFIIKKSWFMTSPLKTV